MSDEDRSEMDDALWPIEFLAVEALDGEITGRGSRCCSISPIAA
jgi:hypothetical protein